MRKGAIFNFEANVQVGVIKRPHTQPDFLFGCSQTPHHMYSSCSGLCPTISVFTSTLVLIFLICINANNNRQILISIFILHPHQSKRRPPHEPISDRAKDSETDPTPPHAFETLLFFAFRCARLVPPCAEVRVRQKRAQSVSLWREHGCVGHPVAEHATCMRDERGIRRAQK